MNKEVNKFDAIDDMDHSLFQILSNAAKIIQSTRENKSNYTIIREVRKYTETHHTNPELSLSHLSDEFNINVKSLSRLFKEEFGENFIDYLAKIRVEHAQKLLQQTNDSVYEISEKVGYTNTNTFIRVFKRTSGFTPGDYREKH
ncbi:helix-turn-helix domain-containing protein [Paenibacillus psychroresistens]|uniref:Helix-turn-helix domain-containing protein n=1 Tax=Paenibacillus psychroresistens TaxID=1778678 RepID=A0A6B8RRP8_9BACL|nr:helix-turn-helix domain-containing protein [Paenibacillus psychroresistens]QGQ98392.1 helix-turn-helix domain-containing protein [Paenibacillus psychroresistens]